MRQELGYNFSFICLPLRENYVEVISYVFLEVSVRTCAYIIIIVSTEHGNIQHIIQTKRKPIFGLYPGLPCT